MTRSKEALTKKLKGVEEARLEMRKQVEALESTAQTLEREVRARPAPLDHHQTPPPSASKRCTRSQSARSQSADTRARGARPHRTPARPARVPASGHLLPV
jgi:hypothetical protein